MSVTLVKHRREPIRSLGDGMIILDGECQERRINWDNDNNGWMEVALRLHYQQIEQIFGVTLS